MANRPKLTESATLELYRVSLENVELQTEIASLMAEYGYNTERISVGKNLLSVAKQTYNLNKTEDDETSSSYKDFCDKREQLEQIYLNHRKKTKVVFLKEILILERLKITGPRPRAYIKWLEDIEKFYTELLGDTLLQSKIAEFYISLEDLISAQQLINELVTARAFYLQERGESQNTTKSKDAAIAEISQWMSDFYAVAKIALDDQPQLLESLGKFVRS